VYVHGVRLQEEISTTIYASAIHIVYAAGELTTERDSDHSATRRAAEYLTSLPARVVLMSSSVLAVMSRERSPQSSYDKCHYQTIRRPVI